MSSLDMPTILVLSTTIKIHYVDFVLTVVEWRRVDLLAPFLPINRHGVFCTLASASHSLGLNSLKTTPVICPFASFGRFQEDCVSAH